jgi:hypothetical protein
VTNAGAVTLGKTSTTKDFSLVTVNAQGVGQEVQQQWIERWCDFSWDILATQEFHTNGDQTEIQDIGSNTQVISGKTFGAKRGQIILIRNHPAQIVLAQKHSLVVGARAFVVASLHLPDSWREEGELEEALRELHEAVARCLKKSSQSTQGHPLHPATHPPPRGHQRRVHPALPPRHRAPNFGQAAFTCSSLAGDTCPLLVGRRGAHRRCLLVYTPRTWEPKLSAWKPNTRGGSLRSPSLFPLGCHHRCLHR